MTADVGFRAQVSERFRALKSAPFASAGSSVVADGVELVAFGTDAVDDDQWIRLLSRWRQENIQAFPRIFDVTEAGTRAWALKRLIEREDRLLFLVRSPGASSFVGHVGLSSFDFSTQSCEIDNIVRGERNGLPGVMSAAVTTMSHWAYTELGVRSITLRVMHDNTRALVFYHRLGFVPCGLEPLIRMDEENAVEWRPCAAADAIDRFYVVMRHARGAEPCRSR